MQQRWAWLREPSLNRLLQFACLGDAVAPKTHRLRNLAEIGILQVRVQRDQAGCLLLDFDESELAVVIDDDLDRQVLLYGCQEITQQHGETTITCETDHLPSGLALLQSERRRHSTGHRAVEQAGKRSAFAASVD